MFYTESISTAPAKAPFYPFLRKLRERPNLAARIKCVDIQGWRSELTDHVKRDGTSFSSTEGSKLFVETAVRAGLLAKSVLLSVSTLQSSIAWYTTLGGIGDLLPLLVRGVEDAHIFLKLALLSNLDSLLIDSLSPFPLLTQLKVEGFGTLSAIKLNLFEYPTSLHPIIIGLPLLEIAYLLLKLYYYI
ncbi:hypothetical protein GMOD_00001092 [Pyrenophora seminiperda CCB06]|uniref:Uncharacterized protein n=1 Tax=Pyrenophora seminiperda CCB06 TaxID=1302712 RepID=A0A3M7LYI5_9PLEO|nr:hypothetical protein GMOD_00001092 [Pyrenophora seminiperda CCB06]